MTLRLNGSTSGYVEIDAPATAGSNTLVLPTGNGSNGQYLQTNGSGALSWATVTQITAETAVATTSGSSITLTGIPSTAKRVVIALNNVSLSGGDKIGFRLGPSSGVATTGYQTVSGRLYGGGSTGSSAEIKTDRFEFIYGDGDVNFNAHAVISHITGNDYTVTIEGFGYGPSNYVVLWSGGKVTLSGVLERFQMFNSGASTFDSGNIRLFYEV